MKDKFNELNEMQLLERNIIKSYNRHLKRLWEEGDMDTLGKLIMSESYRNMYLEKHEKKPGVSTPD